jgi:hypothetical protein
MNAIVYLQLTQGLTKAAAHFHWSRTSYERRREIEREAKEFTAGGRREYQPRSDFVGSPTRTPNIDR